MHDWNYFAPLHSSIDVHPIHPLLTACISSTTQHKKTAGASDSLNEYPGLSLLGNYLRPTRSFKAACREKFEAATNRQEAVESLASLISQEIGGGNARDVFQELEEAAKSMVVGLKGGHSVTDNGSKHTFLHQFQPQ
jgi:hypothetical protein